MAPFLETVNAFAEDTSVIAVVAYVLARQPVMAALVGRRPNRNEQVRLGLLLGMIAVSEAIFPGARYPYRMDTLLVAFSFLAGGIELAATCALVAVVGVVGWLGLGVGLWTAAGFALEIGAVSSLARFIRSPRMVATGVAAGALGQATFQFVEWRVSHHGGVSLNLAEIATTIVANGLGVGLLRYVQRDAAERLRDEQLRLEAQRALALASNTQLAALRARVHPHFLFNTLSSIAGLCTVAPQKAEESIVRLGEIMRRALDASSRTTSDFATEMAHSADYLEIERHRLGPRLCVEWRIDEGCQTAIVPPFALQILVENAINHGIAPKIGRGRILIRARRRLGGVVVAVADDGVGIEKAATRAAFQLRDGQLHGLLMLTQHLELLHGARARVRLFSQPERGTLVVFRVPRGTDPWRAE